MRSSVYTAQATVDLHDESIVLTKNLLYEFPALLSQSAASQPVVGSASGRSPRSSNLTGRKRFVACRGFLYDPDRKNLKRSEKDTKNRQSGAFRYSFEKIPARRKSNFSRKDRELSSVALLLAIRVEKPVRGSPLKTSRGTPYFESAERLRMLAR